MSKYIYILITGMFFHFFAIGQNLGNDVLYTEDTSSIQLHVGGFGHYGSTFLDRKMINKFVFGGFIDNELKGESLSRIRNLNYFGGEYNASISYLDPQHHIVGKFGFYAQMEIGATTGVIAGGDLFELVFYGNTPFRGDTAFINRTEIANYRYQKFAFGLNQNNRLKFGVTISSFNQWEHGRVENGYLYTDDSLNNLELRTFGTFERASKSSNLFSSVGIGIGFDVEVLSPFNIASKHSKAPLFVLGAKNIGVFISDNPVDYYYVDTTYTYDGFRINSIKDFQNSLVDPGQLQDSLLPVATQEQVVRLLPFEVYFYSPSKIDGKKLQMIYGFRYRNKSVSQALVYFGGDYRPTKKSIVSSYLTLGGYTFLQWGLSLRYDFGKFRAGLSSNNMLGWFTQEAYGQSIGANISYRIND